MNIEELREAERVGIVCTEYSKLELEYKKLKDKYNALRKFTIDTLMEIDELCTRFKSEEEGE